MPLPLLLIPIAVTVGSAAAQAVGKLKGRKELNDLRAQLAAARQRHRHLLREYYLRQDFLCRQLGLEPPEIPAALLPSHTPDAEEEWAAQPRWRRLLRRKPRTTLTQGSTGSAKQIVGRHSASVVTSVIWRTTSASVIRVVEPVGVRVIQPVGARLITIAPRFVTLGGGATSSSGSILAGTTARFAFVGLAGFGLLIGPALAAWTVTSEVRKIKKARRDLRILLAQQDMEMAGFRVRNRRLEARYREALEAPIEERELAGSAV